jgi:hypothetical protein
MMHLQVWAFGAVLLAQGLDRTLAQSVALTGDCVAQHQTPPAIYASEGKYTRYYHLLLKLHPQDFELTVPTEQRRPRYTTENRYELTRDGQFEIFVRKEAFPVPAPKCEGYVIVRMPGTDPSKADAAPKLEQKRVLFNALKELKSSGTGTGTYDVAIELNPYVQVVRRDPLQLELTECNVFFRQADGAYIDRVGPLSK